MAALASPLSTVDRFRNQLAQVIQEVSLAESNWGSKEWQQIFNLIDQAVLNDAFRQHRLVRRFFSDIGALVERNCKSLARVQKKMGEQPGKENYFKVLCDFIAVRINCDLSEIQEKIDRIRQIVFANEGQICIKGLSEERPYGFFMDSKRKYTDITQYVYVFLPQIGYPVEFQIGHEFASHTFAIDSALRDDRECGKVDLWSRGFYVDVRRYILDKANGLEPSLKKEAILDKAREIHQGNIPRDLEDILDRI